MPRFISLILLLIVQNSFAQQLDWVKTIGGSAGDGISCLKSWGDTSVIAGTFREEMQLNGNTINSNGGSDIFIHWIDEHGNSFQEIYIGNINNDEIDLLRIDSDRNIYIAARFRGNLSIENQTINSNNSNYFIAKFDANAQLVWLTQSDAKGILRLEDMQLDLEEEHLYLAGYYNDSLIWQNHSLYTNVEANSCILKLNQAGQILWMQETKASRDIKGRAIVPMPNNKLWFMAEFRDTAIILNDTFFFNEVHSDILLAQLDTSGQWLSSKRWGNVLYERPRFLRRSPDASSLWMAGEFVGLLDADSLRLATAYRYYDLFWIQLDSNGNALQAGQSMSNANSYLLDLVVGDQEIWLAGYFQDSLNGKEEMLYSNGLTDAFWYRINTADASLQSAYSFGGAGNDQLRALASVGSRLWAAGDFQASLNLMGSPLESNGTYDGFFAKFNSSINSFINTPRVPHFIEVKIVPNPSQDSFQILTEAPQGLHWRLYNLQGQLIASRQSPQIYWENLPKGTYSLQIETDQGIAVEKVVHQ